MTTTATEQLSLSSLQNGNLGLPNPGTYCISLCPGIVSLQRSMVSYYCYTAVWHALPRVPPPPPPPIPAKNGRCRTARTCERSDRGNFRRTRVRSRTLSDRSLTSPWTTSTPPLSTSRGQRYCYVFTVLCILCAFVPPCDVLVRTLFALSFFR